MKIKVNSSASNKAKTVVSAKAQSVATISAASKIKIGKLEDNVGNLDVGDGLATGETIIYNAASEKWEAVSLEEQVAEAVSEQIGDSVSEALAGAVTLDGGTF
ncbi:hypothetical protein OAA34_00295 [bacterium]|nr:hypothetical protein [bacterium]